MEVAIKQVEQRFVFLIMSFDQVFKQSTVRQPVKCKTYDNLFPIKVGLKIRLDWCYHVHRSVTELNL